MFINALRAQNPSLIATALSLWQRGDILPDTYVIDLPTVLNNARKMQHLATQLGLKLYVMGKQFGRNPLLCREMLKCGLAGIVAVDFKEAAHYLQHNLPVAHLGHLVQPPQALLTALLRARPEVITVYSFEKAQQISYCAQQLGIVQPILLKVYAQGDNIYSGQEGGFAFDSLEQVVPQLQALAGVDIVGATHFPCCLFDGEIALTANAHTLMRTVAKLRELGVNVRHINAPSLTCCESLPLLARLGATHGEPGHALTGTTPANTDGHSPERIAMLYLSEISHNVGEHSYCFGGGYYRRGHLHNALIGENLQPAKVLPVDDSSIDYTFTLDRTFAVGEPVVMCFRTQIFTTRSDVAIVDTSKPADNALIGLFDSLGNPKPRIIE
ncbi:YhfX family PLP-dependent enzyme [Pasteurellaceae bacterium HPA106]|uniref:alanine racemase n=1 Tax=Spirabiliibacterium pneumoniae TaxID=221400 RepID=UPI001AACF5F5|nr:alanine racemase [Spirabiliibacterium pneumoniae]MBE2896031.1 YhfX family PLP-dependent enzyme [Spirabiliibacterium pneumoniae]